MPHAARAGDSMGFMSLHVYSYSTKLL
eukprot:SAG11_NODE_34590_length_271_cov_0.598837_1_plen_26_part_01